MSERFKIPVELMLGIYSGESGGNPRERNRVSGALGLGQVTRETYKYIKRKYFPDDDTTFESLLNPYENMKYSTAILRDKIDEYGGFYRGLYSYGGCRRPETKNIYRRYIDRHLKAVTGKTLRDIDDEIYTG